MVAWWWILIAIWISGTIAALVVALLGSRDAALWVVGIFVDAEEMDDQVGQMLLTSDGGWWVRVHNRRGSEHLRRVR